MILSPSTKGTVSTIHYFSVINKFSPFWMATSSAPLNPQKQQAQLPDDASVGLKSAVSYWRPSPPGSLWKSRSQPRGGQQPTELWRPCTAGLYPSGAGFTCAFLQSKLVILCPALGYTPLWRPCTLGILSPALGYIPLSCTGLYPSSTGQQTRRAM